jgi:hypothetical protein
VLYQCSHFVHLVGPTFKPQSFLIHYCGCVFHDELHIVDLEYTTVNCPSAIANPAFCPTSRPQSVDVTLMSKFTKMNRYGLLMCTLFDCLFHLVHGKVSLVNMGIPKVF